MKSLIITLLLILSINIYANDDIFGLYKNSVSKQPYVIFAARDGLPGHAFIVFGEELDNGLLFGKGTFGFYPNVQKKTKTIKALFSVDGVIDFKWDDFYHDIKIKIKINEDQMIEINNVMAKWKSKNYSLFGNNCTKLTSEVAEKIGLRLPDLDPGRVLPIKYIRELRSLNPQ